jgi:hypothetical protein
MRFIKIGGKMKPYIQERKKYTTIAEDVGNCCKQGDVCKYCSPKTDEELKEAREHWLPKYFMLDGKGYYLTGYILACGDYRISYSEFDFMNGRKVQEDSHFIDGMCKELKYLIPHIREELGKYHFEVVEKLETKHESFTRELTSLINRYSKENGSNTPDYIVAGYIENCLHALNAAVNNREKWYGREPKPVSSSIEIKTA